MYSPSQVIPALRDFYVGRVMASVAALQAVPFDELVNGSMWLVDDGATLIKAYEFKLGSPGAGQEGAIVATAGGYFVPHGGVGIPMVNRLFCNGAAGAAILNADFLTIGADVYEFRNSTNPPLGGTAGRIWVYQGANAAASRANLINAINHVTVNTVAYPVAGVVENFLAAAAAVAATSIDIVSSDVPGGNPKPSATATACTDNLTTATDIWDQATCYGGYLEAIRRVAPPVKVPVTAAMIAQGSVQVRYDFTPSIDRSTWYNQTAAHNIEAVAVVGNSLSMTLAGGGAPKVQPADVLVFQASE